MNPVAHHTIKLYYVLFIILSLSNMETAKDHETTSNMVLKSHSDKNNFL